MNLYVRADSDSNIGTGHIMCCIALAQAWQDQGGGVTFISHCESDALRQRIINEGFDFISVEKPHPDPNDLSQTLAYLKRHSPFTIHASPTWLILDGYHFTPEYQKAVRDAGIRLLVIDDMNHLPHYHADILLNQNIHAPDLTYNYDKDTTLLMGTKYVLLRREFHKYLDFKRQIPERAKNILVTLGGADPDNVTLKVIEALQLLDEPDIMVRIIVGPTNPHQETLHKAIASADFDAELLTNPPDMPELMAWADLAVSGGGGTSLERCFMSLPSLVITIAENQIEATRELEVRGCIIYVGWHKDIIEENLRSIVKSALINNNEIMSNISLMAKSIADGKGVNRVLGTMFKKNI
jgi:UDP-2,4-diacetamido-2,4,6-trideoxy-beta-L-altropyranose hydrolase